jgi:hypothetical protein
MSEAVGICVVCRTAWLAHITEAVDSKRGISLCQLVCCQGHIDALVEVELLLLLHALACVFESLQSI